MAAADRPIRPVGYGDKQTVRVLTVDPERRRVECATRDGAAIYAAIWESPIAFRWPKTGEIWTVRKDTNIWRMDSLVRTTVEEGEAEDVTLDELNEGETRILGDKVFVNELSWNQALKGGLGVIVHAEDGTVARGTDYEHYMWIGTVEPEHMAENDLWVNPE
jgi:hypothetical protein